MRTTDQTDLVLESIVKSESSLTVWKYIDALRALESIVKSESSLTSLCTSFDFLSLESIVKSESSLTEDRQHLTRNIYMVTINSITNSKTKNVYSEAKDNQNSGGIKASSVLILKISKLTDYIKNINSNTKGKKERYDIDDEITEIKKQVFEELNDITLGEISSYFKNLIDTLKAKSKEVKDLTLSQFLSQQAIRLNTWIKSGFKATKI